MPFEQIRDHLPQIVQELDQFNLEGDQTREAFIEQSNTLQRMIMAILLKEEITTPELRLLIDDWCIDFLELERYIFPLGESQSLTYNTQTSKDQGTIKRIVLYSDYVARFIDAVRFSRQEIIEIYFRDIVQALVDVKFFNLGKSICRPNYLPEIGQEHQTHRHMFKRQLDEIFENSPASPISQSIIDFLKGLEF